MVFCSYNLRALILARLPLYPGQDQAQSRCSMNTRWLGQAEVTLFSHQEEQLTTSSACPLEPEEGLKQSCTFAASSPKSAWKNGAQGHCISKTCRVINDNSRPQIYRGKATKRL